MPSAHHFASNRIKTSKYSTNPLSLDFFIWRGLFEQFKRKANIYFFIVGCLQLIPNLSPTGTFTTMSTLGAVVLFSMLKSYYEDYRRHLRDEEVNGQTEYVMRMNPDTELPEFVAVRYTDIRVGDIVRLTHVKGKTSGSIPCDMLLLSASDPAGTVYVETSNLDGETNFKSKRCNAHLQRYFSDLQAGHPSREAPEKTNPQQLDGAQLWADPVLADQAATLQCNKPNGDLYTFNGVFQMPDKSHCVTLRHDNVVFCGSSIRKVRWVVGVCLSTGMETKVMMNARKPEHKVSNLESLLNWLLITVLVLQLIVVVTIAALFVVESKSVPWYVNEDKRSVAFRFLLAFITFLILFNNFIPISLYVTVEIVKMFQGRLMEQDMCMYDAASDVRLVAKTTDLNEELGQVRHVFSDKTGTLTCNCMTLMKFFCNGVAYGRGITEVGRSSALRRGEVVQDDRPTEVLESDFPFFDERISNGRWWTNEACDHLRDLFNCFSLCHTVDVDGDVFEAESPDEAALVKAAEAFGVRFVARDTDTLTIAVGSQHAREVYTVIHTLPFDSERKMMSVLVKTPGSSRYKLLTKGADTSVLERLESARDFNTKKVEATLRQFGEEGLRVMVFAMRELNATFAIKWASKYTAACQTTGKDDERRLILQSLTRAMETDLTLLGATGIEDKVQAGVPETIESLRRAGIKVWMLTGDKAETAVNIGFACSLFASDCCITTLDGIVSLTKITSLLSEAGDDKGKRTRAIVIDGTSLAAVLDDAGASRSFADAASQCETVVCCRVSPKQKASVVSLIRRANKRAVTLSIGDGANDVPMIQTAHVGVGITGVEGRQASGAADYSIAQFRFLHRLVMVHGRTNYVRLSTVVMYSFYKNTLLVMTQFWYCIYNAFTGQSLYEQWTLVLYNIAFTSIAIIVFGVLDRDVLNTDNNANHPGLYRVGMLSQCLNVKNFILWLFMGIMHSAILFFFVVLAWPSGVNEHGETGGLDVVGPVLYASVVITANAKLALHTNSFTIIANIGLASGIVFFFIVLLVMGTITATISSTVYQNRYHIWVHSGPVFVMPLAISFALLPDYLFVCARYFWRHKCLLKRVQLIDSADLWASVREPTWEHTLITKGTAKSATAAQQTSHQLIHAAANDEAVEIDGSTDFLLRFYDVTLEEEFVSSYVGSMLRYKVALALAVVAGLAVASYFAIVAKSARGSMEPVLWGLTSLVAAISLAILLWLRLALHNVHRMLVVVVIIAISCMSTANLEGSKKEPNTHPVSLSVVVLGLITFMQPPFFHAVPYVSIATVVFAASSYIVDITAWGSDGYVVREAELFVVASTSLTALFMSELFSRRMFIAKKQAVVARTANEREVRRSLLLLGNVLPAAIVSEVHERSRQLGQFAITFEQVSSLHSDMVQFTNFCSDKESHVIVEVMNNMFTAFDSHTSRLHIEKIKTIGDAYFCVAGVPVLDPLHQEKIIMMGLQMIEALVEVNRRGVPSLGALSTQIRVGVATGRATAGVFGLHRVCYEVFGESVEHSEKNEQDGVPSRVHIMPLMNNKRTRELFDFETVSGKQLVVGVRNGASCDHLFEESSKDGRFAMPMRTAILDDAYAFLQDDNQERKDTIELWGDFEGAMKPHLVFKDIVAEAEFTKYIQGSEQCRRPMLLLQGTYLFFATAIMSIFFWNVDFLHPVIIVSIVVSALHVAMLVGYHIHRMCCKRDLLSNTVASAPSDDMRDDEDKVGSFVVDPADLRFSFARRVLMPGSMRRVTVDESTGGQVVESNGEEVESSTRHVSRRTLWRSSRNEKNELSIWNLHKLPVFSVGLIYHLFSGFLTLMMPVLMLLVDGNHSITIVVFVVVAGQSYVLSFIDFRIHVRAIVTALHFLFVCGVIFYWAIDKRTFNVAKDGGNLIGIVLAYVLTFIAAYRVELSIRRSFAAGKALVAQQCEAQVAVTRCDKLLQNVLPQEVIRRMIAYPGEQIVDEVESASVMFLYADGVSLKNDTAAAASTVASINAFYWLIDSITKKYSVEKIKTVPYLVVSGCPERCDDHAERLAACAQEIIAAVQLFSHEKHIKLRVKLGIHSGKVTAGVLGSTKFLFDIFGDTVNVASRLASSAAWNTIQVSSITAAALKKTNHRLSLRGSIDLKGKGHQEVHQLQV